MVAGTGAAHAEGRRGHGLRRPLRGGFGTHRQRPQPRARAATRVISYRSALADRQSIFFGLVCGPMGDGGTRRRRRSPAEAEREILDSAERFLRERPLRELTIDEVMSGTGLS